jgi:hypothetical protein
MFTFIKNALSDGTDASSTRLIIFYCMLAFFTTFTCAWGYLSFTLHALQAVPESVTGLIIALGAWHIGGKFMETKG